MASLTLKSDGSQSKWWWALESCDVRLLMKTLNCYYCYIDYLLLELFHEPMDSTFNFSKVTPRLRNWRWKFNHFEDISVKNPQLEKIPFSTVLNQSRVSCNGHNGKVIKCEKKHCYTLLSCNNCLIPSCVISWATWHNAVSHLWLTLNVRKMREAEKVEIFSLYSSMQQKEEVVTATCNGFQITAFLSSYISLAFVHLLHCISELIHFR